MNIESQVVLAPHTTLRVGGVADFFTIVATKEELRSALEWAHKKQTPFFILGGGSNVLIDDRGFRGLVIKNQIPGITYKEDGPSVFVTAGAGVPFDALVESAVARGVWGLENLSGIPGTVGATPIQNVGAYGIEIKDVLVSVEVVDTNTMEVRTLSQEECRFGYRDSLFKHAEGRHLVVTGVTLRLRKESLPLLAYKDLTEYFDVRPFPQHPREVRKAVLEIRKKKFPDWNVIGTAGSFFKNPIVSNDRAATLRERFPRIPLFEHGNSTKKVSLGWILDHICRMRGVREGNVGTYEGQALVLVAHRGASAQEIFSFAKKLEASVCEATGIEIEWEVTKIDK